MEPKIIVTFDEGTKKLLLQRLGLGVDDSGFLIDKETKLRVPSADGLDIREQQLAGITKGSVKLHDSDITSLIKLVDSVYKSA